MELAKKEVVKTIVKESFKKVKESILSVLPIIVIVSILFGVQYALVETKVIEEIIVPVNAYLIFLACSIFLALGMTIFTHGADMSMSKIGRLIAEDLTKKKSIFLVISFIVLLGLIITIAEPDLTVLASYIPGEELNPWLFKLCIGLGLGLFFAIGIIRIITNKSIKYWIVLFYGIVFMIASLFGNSNSEQTFLEISFDSGGVTTGAVSVPFLLAFGIGFAGSRGGNKSSENSFGLTGLCSIGPTLVVLILGLIIKPEHLNATTGGDLTLLDAFIVALEDVGLAIFPIIVVFFIYNFIFLRLNIHEIIRIILGLLYTFIGLVMFLTVANFGFSPIATMVGKGFGEITILILIASFFIGIVSIMADPSVNILLSQVEDISNGVIKKRVLMTALGIGVGLAVLIASLRSIYFRDLPILYILVPGYIICFILTLFSEDLFVALAFDSGGVASGAMTSAFILPFTIGLSSIYEGGTSGFGVIGILGMMPIITVQLVGVLSNARHYARVRRARGRIKDEFDMQIISFNYGKESQE